MAPPEAKTYRCKPVTVDAIHLEEAGTYDVFGTKIEVQADTYVYMDERQLHTIQGETFRRLWELNG